MSVFSNKNPHIKKLVATSTELKDLLGVMGMLSWDQETYLPAKGALGRARQLELLSGIYHDQATHKKLGLLLSTLEENIQNNPELFTIHDKALVREMKRDYTLATKLPKKLVQAMSKESSLGLEAWKHARSQENFSHFAPNLETMVSMKRECAQYYGYSDSPYDALLDEYEQGLTKKKIQSVFDPLKKQLIPIIPKLVAHTAGFDKGILKKKYDQEKLWHFTMHVLTIIGFDLERGRQDKSTHPFTMGMSSNDVRLTTRLLEENPISTLLSTIHEAGHGMYEQGVAPEITDTTLGLNNSLVIHESQSRFWENVIGKSLPFWEFLFPQFQAVFPEQLSQITARDFFNELNVIKPSLIRVDADEITYHLHIIVRSEIEAQMIEGTLKTRDIPEAWNSLMKKYVGVDVPNDSKGVLQDIHWSQGLMGYFPTYSLGSLLSYQIAETIENEHENFDVAIRKGEFEKPLKWLNGKIHQYGRMNTSDEVTRTVTGKSLSAKAFLRHIETKFQL